MKRFLALLLTLVMLVSVCGLQAFAADGDMSADTGDELVVYTRSGATRTFHVGDTFSYTYWFRLTSGSVNKITGHVLYDSQCLSVNADGCKFPNMTSPSTKNNAGDFEFHDTFTTSQGGEFATTSPQTMANISFTVTRGGTAYLTTLLEELEIRKSNGDKSELVTNFKNKTWSPAMYSTFDYLQDEKPSLASTPLSASSDVAWFYAVDAETGAPIPAGVTFELTGTSDNGKHIERSSVSARWRMANRITSRRARRPTLRWRISLRTARAFCPTWKTASCGSITRCTTKRQRPASCARSRSRSSGRTSRSHPMRSIPRTGRRACTWS